jgi:hypothetical protein
MLMSWKKESQTGSKEDGTRNEVMSTKLQGMLGMQSFCVAGKKKMVWKAVVISLL